MSDLGYYQSKLEWHVIGCFLQQCNNIWINFELRPSSHAHNFYPRLNPIWKDNHKAAGRQSYSQSRTQSQTQSQNQFQRQSHDVLESVPQCTHLFLPISNSLAWPPSHSHILSASLRNKLAFPECTRTNPPQGAVQMPRKITSRCLAVFLCYLGGNLAGTRSTSDCGFLCCPIIKTRQPSQFNLYFWGILLFGQSSLKYRNIKCTLYSWEVQSMFLPIYSWFFPFPTFWHQMTDEMSKNNLALTVNSRRPTT